MDKIQNLLNLNIEIEGLLRTMLARPTAEAQNMLYAKFDEYAALFYEAITPAEINEEEPAADIPAVEIPASEPPKIGIPAVEIPVMEIKEEEEIKEEGEEPVKEKEEEPPVIIVPPQIISAPTELKETEAVADVLNDNTTRIDQMISRNEAKDLSKAFTINDKFRFIRELFGNNRTNFNQSLAEVSKMQRFDEAFTYFVEIHGFDPEEPNAKDFLEIIANHF